MVNEKCKKCGHYHGHSDYNMNEFETKMAMAWGTPKGLSRLLIAVSVFLLSIGGFLWLLHLADIIK